MAGIAAIATTARGEIRTGARGGSRTPDTGLRTPLLYPLSYAGLVADAAGGVGRVTPTPRLPAAGQLRCQPILHARGAVGQATLAVPQLLYLAVQRGVAQPG